MGFRDKFKKDLFNTTKFNFKEKAILLFKYQAKNNHVYHSYLKYLKINIDKVWSIDQIPFLPISFFKTQTITSCKNIDQEFVFTSSGTTGLNTSRHIVYDLKFYLNNTEHIFNHFYGPLSQYTFLALLPSYLERTNSSLIKMSDYFINQSHSLDSGYYLYNHEDLAQKLITLKQQQKPTILIGVTFALLDFIEKHQLDFEELIIIETGGMKGRKEEVTREEVHQQLKNGFGVKGIHSEYGMTELLSQAYAIKNGVFTTPPWMEFIMRDITDPFNLQKERGGINIIDLANVDSCAFIATDDIGQKIDYNKFKVLGRLDNSLIRGCNLMVN